MFPCQGNSQDGCQVCPEGTYRGTAELFSTRSCLACPIDAWSMTTVSSESCPSVSYERAEVAWTRDLYVLFRSIGE